MKKPIALLCAAALLLCLAACGKTAPETPTPTDGETTAAAEPQGDPLRLRIVDGEGTGSFLLAGEASGQVYTASRDELTVFLDGEPAKPSDLKNGMTATVDPGYELLETWPAQFAGATLRAERFQKGSDDHGDLCGLYLTVLEDLWAVDGALNEGIDYISFDLSGAPGGLTDGEIAAVAWRFTGKHGGQPLLLDLAALRDNGYLADDGLSWKDGVLLRISGTENAAQTAGKLTFDTEKWRSGTGAIFYTGCTAKRDKHGGWEDYKPGGFAIA